jgi:stage V sporulation protein R
MRGSPLLIGNNTSPGQSLTDQEKECYPKILQACTAFGCDFFPTIIQKVTYDEMSEVAAYGGFPRRYPHWSFGQQWEELQKGYEYGVSKIFELVINTSPCVIYVMTSNTFVDNLTVVAHATFHNDFFKNNIYFDATDRDMMNRMANHGSRIRRYMDRWGAEKVIQFVDHVLRIQTLIDPAKAWNQREIKDYIIRDSRDYEIARRIPVDQERMYMEPWLNPKDWKEYENKRIEKSEAKKDLGIFEKPEKDVIGFIKDNAPLKPWQADIVAMLYEEALYFAPQRQTKTLNESWAGYGDYEIMTRQGYVSLGQKTGGDGIVQYAKHKMSVLGGKYSMNPYKFMHLLLDIEDRWNKGKFGQAWDDCKNLRQRTEWDLKLGLGKQKVFDVRRYHNDVTFIREFFTQEFCQEYEFFEWKYYPNGPQGVGEYRIENRGDTPESFKRIKDKLIQSRLNGGLPDIRLVDPNHRGQGIMLLQHWWDGRVLYESYARETITSLYFLWGKEVILATRDNNGKEIVFYCAGLDSDKDVAILTREEFEEKW